jgi:hypothetical protein
VNGDPNLNKRVHDYESAGFNGFFRRSLGSHPDATTLRQLNTRATRSLNFDDQQISGSLGDTLRVGAVTVEGKVGRVVVHDEQNNEVVELGDIRNE